MANQLKVAKVLSIQALHARGWSQRRIARELGIHRETVARHLGEPSKPATVPPGSGAGLELSKPATALTGCDPILEHEPTEDRLCLTGGITGEMASTGSSPLLMPGDAGSGTRSQCEPYRKEIIAELEQGLSAQRIFQDLVSEHGFDGKYHSVRRFVAKLRRSTPLPFRRIEVAPGEEAKLDFGAGAPILQEDGRRRRTHVLRVVLNRSIFDVVRDFLHDEAMDGHDRVLARYLKPDLLIIDDFGMKQLPKRSGEFLFEIVMRRYETRSTMMTTNRPLEDWGKLLGDVPTATAILDRFLHHAEIITLNGKSYRLDSRGQDSKPATAPTGSKKNGKAPKPAKAPTGSDAEQLGKETAKSFASQTTEN